VSLVGGGGACRRASSCEAEVALAEELRRTVSGRRPTMVERDISRKGGLAVEGQCIRCIFSCGDN